MAPEYFSICFYLFIRYKVGKKEINLGLPVAINAKKSFEVAAGLPDYVRKCCAAAYGHIIQEALIKI